MEIKFIEVETPFNYGKFAVGRWTGEEWRYQGHVPDAAGYSAGSLLRARGWGGEHLWVLDLETGEGACFRPGGCPSADLEKHQIWVCPLFEPFLTWLYQQDLSNLEALPATVELSLRQAPPALWGYRRPGPEEQKNPWDEV
jgi:hypothetical protein